jgi:hypothetical protein
LLLRSLVFFGWKDIAGLIKSRDASTHARGGAAWAKKRMI